MREGFGYVNMKDWQPVLDSNQSLCGFKDRGTTSIPTGVWSRVGESNSCYRLEGPLFYH